STTVATTVPTTPATTVPPTTPPPTDPPATDPPTTTATTQGERALKRQIADDYLRAERAYEELTANPTMDDLDARVAEIVDRRSSQFEGVRDAIIELVENDERIIKNDPDYSTLKIERVELKGRAPHRRAVVIYCDVDNRKRIDAEGNTIRGTGILVGSRRSDLVRLTASGRWLPYTRLTNLWQEAGATACPPI
ncbi:MAG: hypothetical protein M3517_08570, partial [Actinomycetota bacterium]|nr:hypothetical protein [Actinomycetota bacterium]